MPTREGLEQMDLSALERLCQEVANKPSEYSELAAEKAGDLILEWVSLQALPIPDLKEQRKIEAQQESLKKRMCEFLASTL